MAVSIDIFINIPSNVFRPIKYNSSINLYDGITFERNIKGSRREGKLYVRRQVIMRRYIVRNVENP